MGFTINVWNLYALAHCSHRRQLPYYPSNRLVAACTDVSEFIHPHTNSTALQEKLHECLDGLLLALLGFLVLLLVTFLYILPSANETLPLIISGDCLRCSTACSAVECHLHAAERKTGSTLYHRKS